MAFHTQRKTDAAYLDGLAKVQNLGYQVETYLDDNKLDAIVPPTGGGDDYTWAPVVASCCPFLIVCPSSNAMKLSRD